MNALEETRAALASPEALAAIEADPYWPKWDAPWWRLVLLSELGLAASAPRATAAAFDHALATHYLPFFPLRVEEVPPGKDPVRHVACHCQLATLDRVLFECGIDVDRAHPWIREWYARYALPDGGWNCDEAAYTRPVPRSSVVSTVPVLEALLRRRDLSARELELVDRAAGYLIERRLVRSLSKGGAVARPEWLLPAFPRFYEYDILRGLSVLARWGEVRGREVPRAAIAEALETLEGLATATGEIAPRRRVIDGPRTLRRAPDGTWLRGQETASFPLLDLVSALGVASPVLGRAWREARERLGTAPRSVTSG